MESVTVHQAKTNLSKLLKLVEEGQEVEIRRGSVPVAWLVAPTPSAEARQGLLGCLAGPDVWMSEDFDDPIPGTEWAYGDLLPKPKSTQNR